MSSLTLDIIIGNPPYQMADGGGTGSSAIPLYNKFVDLAERLKPKNICMIIPARWYAGGKGLDAFREKMLSSEQITALVDYPNSADCFPGVIIAGGICYFLWDRDYNGMCKVVNMKGEETVSTAMRRLNEYDTFIRDNKSIQIIDKVQSKKEDSIQKIVYARNCFNLLSNTKGHSIQNTNDVVLYSLAGKSYIEKEKISDRDGLVNRYKVIMTKAMSGGNKPSSDGNYLVISNTIRVLKPEEVCTETYLCIGSFDNEVEAENPKSYMKTKFFRFLLLQSLSSINISKEKFNFIPMQNFRQTWSDEKLYSKYNLSDSEIEIIEKL